MLNSDLNCNCRQINLREGSIAHRTRSATRSVPVYTTAPVIGVKRGSEHIVETFRDPTLRTSRLDRSPFDTEAALIVGRQAALQSGSYALEIMSCTHGTRVHCFACVIRDDRLYFWYYDASGVVCTEQCLSLIYDFEKAMAIIIAMARCTPDQVGILPCTILKPPTYHPDVYPPPDLRGYTLRMTYPGLPQKVTVTLQEPLFTQYTLTGRRTFLYGATTSPVISTREVVIKFSYQVKKRPREHDLVDHARNAGVGHLPEVLMWCDLWDLSHGVRGRISGKPNPRSKKEPTYEERTLRAIVYVRYGDIRSLFAKRCDLIPVMVNQMIDCKSRRILLRLPMLKLSKPWFNRPIRPSQKS